jgi:hypothetical protein
MQWGSRLLALAGGLSCAGLLACSTEGTFIGDGAGGAGGTSSGAGSSGSGGAATSCTTPTECPGEDDACNTRTCEDGGCAMETKPAGTPITVQTGGDCKKDVCSATGQVTTEADNTDAPSDGNPCTTDGCEAGSPSYGNAPEDTPCGDALACNANGQCAGCVDDAQCGESTACATVSCNDMQICVYDNVPAGQGDPGGQTPGDCQRQACNGNGGVGPVVDDADVPVDGNPCTSDVCTAGAPSNPNAPAGTGCPGGVCNGGGACVACLQDADCGATSACVTSTCNGGSCQVTYVPAGQGDPGGQVGGNCHTLRCNGNGGVGDYVDDADLPNDGNACTYDVCSNGNPSNPNATQDDGESCTTDVCNPANGVTDHIPVGNGTACGAPGNCLSCQNGTCASSCNGCQYCYQDTCYQECFPADCLKCNISQTGCVPIQNCQPQ